MKTIEENIEEMAPNFTDAKCCHYCKWWKTGWEGVETICDLYDAETFDTSVCDSFEWVIF